MPNLEEAIRERAYHLWVADGRPEGRADIYWLTAQHEILATSLEGPALAVDAVPTKPARKTRAARSDKAKTRAA
jgi:Protein of unknown function (DUF2934)